MSGATQVVHILEEEIHQNTTTIHSTVNQLVQGFIKYLKEPRYQSPLTADELSKLFNCFYRDLNSTVLSIYTQSNSIKKQLIAGSDFFKSSPKQFDYLLAIANYSSSSIKLVRRTDPEALAQLRIFNFYKVLTVLDVIEQGQIALLKSINNKEDDISLYEKIFKFDEKDLILQRYLDKKLHSLKSLDLSLVNFIEKQEKESLKELIEFLNNPNPAVQTLLSDFSKIKDAITPFSKLKIVVEFQKKLIELISQNCHLSSRHINNDLLLPILIYLFIYKVDAKLDLFLTFNFVKHFVNFVDPYEVSVATNPSFYFYNPNETPKNPLRKTTLYECVNLDEVDTREATLPETPFFKSDKEVINFINSNYLNNSELNYYLTNFEAVLFFIQNVTSDELTDKPTTEEILLKPLSALMEREMVQTYEFPKTSIDGNRSRSSSLFNTITTRFNEVSTRNRSRSNSGALKNAREIFPSIDTTVSDNTVASQTSPVEHDNSTFGMMKNLMGRFSSVSVLQFKSNEDEEELMSDPKHARSGSILDKLSPNHSRTRSSSLETGSNISPNKKNSIASKLSSGVSDLMVKFNQNPANNGTLTLQSINTSETSLKSLEEQAKRPEYARARTSSVQIMEKWFNNISNNQHQIQTKALTSKDGVSAIASAPVHTAVPSKESLEPDSHEGSVFSTPSKELARFYNADFDLLTILDLRTLKVYYDQLCNELGVSKFESKSTTEELNDQISSVNSI